MGRFERDRIKLMTNSIDQFIADLELTSPDFAAVAQQVRAIYREIEPTVEEKFIYGGIGFFLGGSHFGGVYPHTKHLNIVFSRGNQLSDPDGLLQGKGKFRRFVRAASVEDLVAQKVREFVAQSVELEE